MEFFSAEWVRSLSRGEFIFGAVVLCAVTLVCFVVLFIQLRRKRTIENTPTSKIRSAQQGYVEITGEAEPNDYGDITSPGGRACLWYHYIEEERVRDYSSKQTRYKWRKVRDEQSTSNFKMRDATGWCFINDHEDAAIYPKHDRRWRHGNRRYREKLICAGDELLCLGLFQTEQGPTMEELTREEQSALLNRWKRDREKMLRDFDTNADGEVDLKEWQAAREKARELAAEKIEGEYKTTLYHNLNKPLDSRHPFIISAKGEKSLTRWYSVMALVSFGLFLSIGSYGAFFISTRIGN